MLATRAACSLNCSGWLCAIKSRISKLMLGKISCKLDRQVGQRLELVEGFVVVSVETRTSRHDRQNVWPQKSVVGSAISSRHTAHVEHRESVEGVLLLSLPLRAVRSSISGATPSRIQLIASPTCASVSACAANRMAVLAAASAAAAAVRATRAVERRRGDRSVVVW
jgi:hypothetical protein